MILIVDFGSQTTHLIGRRVRELGVDVEIVEPEEAISTLNKFTPKGKFDFPKGIILSGGPASVFGKEALLVDREIFHKGIPVLGICYGLQLMAHLLGGIVAPGKKKEYGSTQFKLIKNNSLFAGWEKRKKDFIVWMSHFDQVIKPPHGTVITGSTEIVEVAAFADEDKKFYGIMFHPEAHHTEFGREILSNFVFNICQETPANKKITVDDLVKNIAKEIGKEKTICALSGGIDSSVAAVLTHHAIGENLTCFYVDTGLMRLGETEQIEKTFKTYFHLNLKVIQAENVFLQALKGIVDPEEKRKIIGETFIRVFEKESHNIGATCLVQGTIYPDVIESKGTKHADKIKTHHNVGGIPSKHKFKLVEPLRMYYKDEVRMIAGELNFPKELVTRHVFPGPGLAVRIIGEVTGEKLDILRRADQIVVEEIRKAGLYENIWMAFAVLTSVKSTGVTGDERKYGETIAVRVIESKDTMTADWVRLPYDVLADISNRIVNEVYEVVRVVYDITTKPPGTMEWE